ncbi:MAG: flagellar filament outer layer protein FlaA [Spirochaetia bacterium]|nr:flagellar filament outer layer protein FlaA [Spirochaetia bacterium]
MKQYKKSAPMALISAVVIVFGMTAKQADSRVMTNVAPDLSGEELRAVVVEDFETSQITTEINGDGWYAETNPKKYEKAETEAKLKRKDPVLTLEMKFIPGGPNDLMPEEWSVTDKGKTKEKVLGVKFKFRYPGPNVVNLLVPKEVDWKNKKPYLRMNYATGKEEQERGLQLPGKAKAISLWVHGRGNPYELEAWIEDYRGDTHILRFGSVDFVGWRPMKAYIPANIPQTSESYPQIRASRITRLVLRAQTNHHYEELITDTYFFFDQIKCLTDTYEVNFDGQDLHDLFDGNEKK